MFIGLCAALWLSWHCSKPIDSRVDLYKTYMTYTMHEDGSYEALQVGGYMEWGCVKGAICED